MYARVLLVSIFLAAVLCGGTFMYAVLNFGIKDIMSLPILWANEPNSLLSQKSDGPISIIFTGDVMLARDVEMRLLREERGYLLSAMKDTLSADAVVMNFEASVPEKHIQTKHMEMRFSVRQDLISELSLSSPTYLSLANNHSLDYGVAGYNNTVRVLEGAGFRPYGHASRISTTSLSVIERKDQRILVLHVNATYGKPDISLIKNIVDSAGPANLTVAYIHWGTEYEPLNDNEQKNLAHSLIDSGFDLIVGHHPHVVQNIERYKDGLIFYSLGNFIFDQYWRPEVEEGLILKLVGEGSGWKVALVPVESTTVRAQPRLMLGEARQTFLEGLANRSDRELAEEISFGLIYFDITSKLFYSEGLITSESKYGQDSQI